MEAMMAMFSIEIFVTNVWVTMVLAVLFVVNMLIGCCSKVSRYICAMYTSTRTPPQANFSDGITSSVSVNNPISDSNRPTNMTDSDVSIGNMHDTGMELSKIA